MTALREDAYAMLDRIPEDKLHFLIDIMRGIEGLYPRKKNSENSQSFQKLMKLCRPIPDLDEDEELASWRKEKFGYADID